VYSQLVLQFDHLVVMIQPVVAVHLPVPGARFIGGVFLSQLRPYCRAPLPPGFEYITDQCYQMAARIERYALAESDKKRAGIAQR
jgi:hypothetical protein